MAKTATDIITKALTLVDERLTDLQDAASTEMSLTDMAVELLPEVARNLIKILPFELKKYISESGMLTPENLSNGEVQTGFKKRKVAFVPPADFWELVSLKLGVWSKPVNSYILIDSPEYNAQNNPFTRGGKQNPVVAVSSSNSGDFRIECFSIGENDAATVALFEYISFNNVPGLDSGLTWPDELFDKITRALASELNVIKGRLQEGEIQGSEAMKSIEQHE